MGINGAVERGNELPIWPSRVLFVLQPIEVVHDFVGLLSPVFEAGFAVALRRVHHLQKVVDASVQSIVPSLHLGEGERRKRKGLRLSLYQAGKNDAVSTVNNSYSTFP